MSWGSNIGVFTCSDLYSASSPLAARLSRAQSPSQRQQTDLGSVQIEIDEQERKCDLMMGYSPVSDSWMRTHRIQKHTHTHTHSICTHTVSTVEWFIHQQ